MTDRRTGALGVNVDLAIGGAGPPPASRTRIVTGMIQDATILAADMAAGAAAGNVGTLGGSLVGTLPNPTLAANSVGASQITDGTVGTAELANTAVTNAKLASDTARANLLTNGGFEIWQRGNGPFNCVSGGAVILTADRWYGQLAAGSGTFTVTRDTATVPPYSQISAKLTYTAGAADAVISFHQQFGGSDWINLKGAPLTFAINVFAPSANRIRTWWVDNTLGARQYGAYNQTANSWERLSQTFTISPGASTSFYYGVEIQPGASATVYVDNAMLVVGSTPADYVPLHPADDLARCLRYYEKIDDDGGNVFGVVGIATAASQFMDQVAAYRVVKPVTPTVTVLGTWSAVNCGATPSTAGTNKSMLKLRATANAAGQFYVTNSGGTANVTVEANP